MPVKSIEIRIAGIVQGVGFRPFVYAKAIEHALQGFVCNDGEGVWIGAEGNVQAIDAFLKALERELPPLARVDKREIIVRDPQNYTGFEIRPSTHPAAKRVPVSPDMAMCPKCEAQLQDPSDRRYGYYLINCTDCGPRYSIIRTVPYDRVNTSMTAFTMCADCRSEYENPLDRRYHAQPISCHDCGPVLEFSDGETALRGQPALDACIRALKAGKIVAVKGLGGFHLLCDATNEAAVDTLRRRKRRPKKPLAVMFRNVEGIRQAASLDTNEAALIASKEKPIVLVLKKASGNLAPSVAPDIDRLGVFIPYTPLHFLLLHALDFPLVATSANLSDEPIMRDEAALRQKLSGVFDALLTHGREILNACDDSVMQAVRGRAVMLRLARGFAPLTLPLVCKTDKKILALGAHQKSALALAMDEQMIVSPHIGDLESIEAFEYFERTLETFKRIYDFEPDLIVCDKHPGYRTTQWAKQQNKPLLQVQHHHAHILSVMAEYDLDRPVLGFAFDGTGYGDDGSVWGGEVLCCEGNRYERAAHWRPFRLIGAEAAVKEPRRCALGLLFEMFPLEEVLRLETPAVQSCDPAYIRRLHQVWSRQINSPACTSVGRLFDAAASLIGLKQNADYEGQCGLLLEAAAADAALVPLETCLGESAFDFAPLVSALIAPGHTPQASAAHFIATIGETVVETAKAHTLPVVLGGGVFQNRTLLGYVMEQLEREKIPFYVPRKLPVNDGCIAAGQIRFALNVENDGKV